MIFRSVAAQPGDNFSPLLAVPPNSPGEFKLTYYRLSFLAAETNPLESVQNGLRLPRTISSIVQTVRASPVSGQFEIQ